MIATLLTLMTSPGKLVCTNDFHAGRVASQHHMVEGIYGTEDWMVAWCPPRRFERGPCSIPSGQAATGGFVLNVPLILWLKLKLVPRNRWRRDDNLKVFSKDLMDKNQAYRPSLIEWMAERLDGRSWRRGL